VIGSLTNISNTNGFPLPNRQPIPMPAPIGQPISPFPLPGRQPLPVMPPSPIGKPTKPLSPPIFSVGGPGGNMGIRLSQGANVPIPNFMQGTGTGNMVGVAGGIGDMQYADLPQAMQRLGVGSPPSGLPKGSNMIGVAGGSGDMQYSDLPQAIPRIGAPVTGAPMMSQDRRITTGGSSTFDERGTDSPLQTNLTGPSTATPSAQTSTQPVADVGAPSTEMPFAAGVTQVATGLDPLTEQLLFGIGGQGGFIPGAMRAAEKVFYDEQGNPVVIDEQVAGFSPDQIRAIEMQRRSLGLQDPFIRDARSALEGSMAAYDPSITGQFFNPFEDAVVQQTIKDITERGEQEDIAARASDIARGGQSAFGSRARLGAAERQRALGRGLGEVISGIRSRGFSEAQQTGLGEFARQRAAQRAAASGIAGLGAQAAGASASDIAALFGLGGQQQNQLQRILDAERRNLLQRQQTPLLQYQALAPFISMAPAGQFQTRTEFTPRPSPLQEGLGVGLSAFGGLGQFLNQ